MEKEIELDWLLRVRLVVARCGEMDALKWWNTTGQLGPYGAKVLRRGFPRTHNFAQARSVFAVAAHRCAQVFDPPESATFWRLPDQLEEAFDARWEEWLDSAEKWAPVFDAIAAITDFNIVSALKRLSLVDEIEVARAGALKLAEGGKGVHIPGPFDLGRKSVALLALGFGKGDAGELVVPYSPLKKP